MPPLRPVLREGIEEGFGFQEVGGVVALGETAIDWCQQRMGLGALPRALPQAAQAGGGAQLPGFRLLAAGNSQGLMETGFRLRLVRYGLLQQQDALEAICLRQQVTLPAGLELRPG